MNAEETCINLESKIESIKPNYNQEKVRAKSIENAPAGIMSSKQKRDLNI